MIDPVRDKFLQWAKVWPEKAEQKRSTYQGVNMTPRRQRMMTVAYEEAEVFDYGARVATALARARDKVDVPDFLMAVKHGKTILSLANAALRAQRGDGNDYLYRSVQNYFGTRDDFEAALDWIMLHADGDAEEKKQRMIDLKLADVMLRRPPGFFPTPVPVIEKMHDMLHYGYDREKPILEPSAGAGHIADFLVERGYRVECIERDVELREILTLKGHEIVGRDVMKFAQDPATPWTGDRYDAAMMNPPFENGQAIEHVMRVSNLVAKQIVAVLPEGVFYNKAKKFEVFRSWMEPMLLDEVELDVGAFAESGTNVKARIVSLDIEEMPF